ncbi:MAG TPA: hypothetical protein VM053_12545 [Gemmatimonadaceae bacterium]|nr:hypothetical protein [Gemmatimonadaceae bacterium]
MDKQTEALTLPTDSGDLIAVSPAQLFASPGTWTSEFGPPRLSDAGDTGLNELFIRALLLKVMYGHGLQSASDISKVVKLPVTIVRDALEAMRMKALLESLGADAKGRQLDLRYNLTNAGKEGAQQALRQSLYSGPAPVPVAQWQAQVKRQSILNDRVDQSAINESLKGLVIPRDMMARFGPAVNAGRGILLYGAPGDGKTSIAQAIARSFRQPVWVPYAIEVDGEIIKLFDPAIHQELPPAPGSSDNALSIYARSARVANDRRWVRCSRPVMIVGGELTMEMLELRYDPIGNMSEAPIHTKVTGGVLVIDDFGRQIAKPEQVLNRWVLPLESRIDYLTLHNGKKFAVTFDGLMIFSTNLTPRAIMDSAMMRRIPYNFHIGPPTYDEYVKIFKNVCRDHGLEFDLDVVRMVMSHLYEDENLPMARFHPRFIVDHLLAHCSYEGRAATMDPKLVLDAAEHLYTKH